MPLHSIHPIDLGRPVRVLDRLLLGSYECALDREILEVFTIRRILNVADVLLPGGSSETLHLHVPLSDHGDSDLATVIPQCSKLIDEGRDVGHTVLVHCALGVNRSPTVVLGYLVHRRGWTLRRAYAHLYQRRSFISPHTRYIKQLCELDEEYHGKPSISLEQILEEFPARVATPGPNDR